MTATKRFSALNHTLPFRTILPIPDGTIDAGDRAVPLYLYAIAGQAPSAEPVFTRRIALQGTSQERFTLVGTSRRRITIEGTSRQRRTLRGTSP